MTPLSRRTFLKAAGGALAVTGLPRWARAQGTPIRLGLQADLNGSLADYGYWHAKVVRAAVDKLNAAGGINGRSIALTVQDTESDPETGRRALQRLVLEDRSDFVIGSQHSAVSLASLPAARELGTLYFPLGEATEITTSEANRHSFRVNHSVRSHVEVGYRWAVENLGKNWTIVVANYAFGQSHAREWPPKIESVGGTVLQTLFVPLDATDFLPFWANVDLARTDVLLHVFPGRNALNFFSQGAELGFLDQVAVFGVICSVDGIAFEDVPPLEGSWYISNHPRRADQVPDHLQAFDGAFRRAAGVSAAGRELGTDRATAGSHFWYPWEIVHLIAQAAEATGWSGPADHATLAQHIEGIALRASEAYFQGDKLVRAEDHQGFHAHYLERLEDGELVVKRTFEPERSIYPPEIDLTQQPF